MQQRPLTGRPIEDARADIAGGTVAYCRYLDPTVFPRFGGDDFDPPPYSNGRRSTPPAGAAPRRLRWSDLLFGFAAAAPLILLAARR